MASRFYLEYEGIVRDADLDKTIWDVYDSKSNDMIMAQIIVKDEIIVDLQFEPDSTDEQKEKIGKIYGVGKYFD